MRLHNPIPEISANPFLLLGGCVYNSSAKFRWISSKITVWRTQFVHFFCLSCSLCGHNMLQSAVASTETSKHGRDNHLNISIGDINSVQESQSLNQDREKTTKPKEKLVPSRTSASQTLSANKSTAKSLVTHTATTRSTDQSTRVLHDLKKNGRTFSISHWLRCNSWLLQWSPRWTFSLRLKCLVRGKEMKWVNWNPASTKMLKWWETRPTFPLRSMTFCQPVPKKSAPEPMNMKYSENLPNFMTRKEC